MVVAVADAPPRRDAVDQLASIGQHDPAPVRPHDGQRRRGDLHLAIRQPDVGQARSYQGRRIGPVNHVQPRRSGREAEPCASVLQVPRQPRQRMDRDIRTAENPQALDRLGQSHALGRFGHDDRAHGHTAAAHCREGRERMAERAQVSAGDEDRRIAQLDDQVEARRIRGHRRHHAPRAFDQPDRTIAVRILAAEPHDFRECHQSPLAPRRQVRRDRGRGTAMARSRRSASSVGAIPRLLRMIAGSLSGIILRRSPTRPASGRRPVAPWP